MENKQSESNTHMQKQIVGDSPSNLWVKVGDYEIRVRPQLAQGGSSKILLGRILSLDRECVIKLLHVEGENLAHYEEFLARFRREIETLMRLDDLKRPWFPRIYGTGTLDGKPFISMEKIEGRDLREMIESRNASIAERMRYSIEVLHPLADLHAARHVHRDVKPANIMVRNDGQVFLLDFSIVKKEDETLYTRNQFVGTPRYAVADQMKDASLAEPWWDLFSWAVTSYHVLTGQLLLDTELEDELGLLDIEAEQKKLQERGVREKIAQTLLKSGVPKWFVQIIIAVLLDRGEKFKNAQQLLAEIDERRHSLTKTRRLFAGIATLVFFVAATASYIFLQPFIWPKANSQQPSNVLTTSNPANGAQISEQKNAIAEKPGVRIPPKIDFVKVESEFQNAFYAAMRDLDIDKARKILYQYKDSLVERERFVSESKAFTLFLGGKFGEISGDTAAGIAITEIKNRLSNLNKESSRNLIAPDKAEWTFSKSVNLDSQDTKSTRVTEDGLILVQKGTISDGSKAWGAPATTFTGVKGIVLIMSITPLTPEIVKTTQPNETPIAGLKLTPYAGTNPNVRQGDSIFFLPQIATLEFNSEIYFEKRRDYFNTVTEVRIVFVNNIGYAAINGDLIGYTLVPKSLQLIFRNTEVHVFKFEVYE